MDGVLTLAFYGFCRGRFSDLHVDVCVIYDVEGLVDGVVSVLVMVVMVG